MKEDKINSDIMAAINRLETNKPEVSQVFAAMDSAYEDGVNHCIEIVEKFLLHVPGLAEPLISKLKALKKS